jgi:hypothetical protein
MRFGQIGVRIANYYFAHHSSEFFGQVQSYDAECASTGQGNPYHTNVEARCTHSSRERKLRPRPPLRTRCTAEFPG